MLSVPTLYLLMLVSCSLANTLPDQHSDLGMQRSRRSAPAPHPDTCLVCKALDNSPQDVVCGHAVHDLEGFTQQHCDELTSNADACPNHCPSEPTGLLGSEKCTWGPAFWCSQRINAHSCGGAETVKFCEESKQGFASATSRSRRSVSLPGSEKCTWGPAFWCSARINAHSCGGAETVKFCEESKQGFGAAISRSRRSGLSAGSNKCTWGPAFWCSQRINAHSCGGAETVKFCEESKQGFAAAP